MGGLFQATPEEMRRTWEKGPTAGTSEADTSQPPAEAPKFAAGGRLGAGSFQAIGRRYKEGPRQSRSPDSEWKIAACPNHAMVVWSKRDVGAGGVGCGCVFLF